MTNQQEDGRNAAMRRHHVVAWLLPAVVGLSLCSCKQKDETELVITVWSDLLVPSELDSLRIRVDGHEQFVERPFQLTATDEPGRSRIPVQLALVPAGAKDLPITVTAVGSYQGTDIVSQKAALPFIPSQARELVLYLARSCKNISCDDHSGYTCEGGACTRPVAVDTASLSVYTPKQVAPPPDASPASASFDAAPLAERPAVLPDVAPSSDQADVVPAPLDASPRDSSSVTAAVLGIDKPIVSLGTLDPGKSGVATVTLTNTGKAASGPVSISATAGLTAIGCSGSLAPAASCTITITATPTAVGPFSGTVTIAAGPGTGTPLQISVHATVGTGGGFSVSPPAIDLGSIAVGVPAPKQTITVTAAVDLTGLAYSSSGANIAIDQAATTCTSALASGTSCTIAVDFIATTSGQKQDTIVITASGLGTQTVPVTANAQAPVKLAMSPTNAQFACMVGDTSSPVGFGVVNLGDVATGPLVVTITGVNAASFAQTNTCLALASLGTCTITVLYKPVTAAAAETATLTVTDSAGTATASATLHGTPVTPSILTITSSTTDLGAVPVGTTGVTTVFTVTNSGDSASGTLMAAVSSPEFVITDDSCTGASIPTAGTCTVSVVLKPTSVGAKAAMLTVTGSNGNPAMKSLTGVGISPASLSVIPLSLDFGSVRVNATGTEQPVTVTNNGGMASGAFFINKTGDFNVFPITANTCAAPLPPAGSCTFTVNFAPTSAESYAAAYTVTDGTTSATVTLSGTGLGPTNIIVTPGSIGSCTSSSPPCFPDTDVGGTSSPVTFTVEASSSFPAGVADTGAIAVTLTDADASHFAIATNGCTTPLLAGATCTVSVELSPTSAGTKQATLYASTANGGLTFAMLSANGT